MEIAEDGAKVLADPSVEQIRRAIEAQMCPWCERGPFQRLASHTYVVHQVRAGELRKMAGLNARAHICSPAVEADARERLAARPDREEMVDKGAALARRPGHMQPARLASAELSAKELAAATPTVLAMWDAGDLIEEIAVVVGLHRETVRKILRKHGRGPNQKRAMMNPTNRARAVARMHAAQVLNRERQAQIRAERVREFTELGGDVSALAVVAERWGLSRKVARYYLRRNGVIVKSSVTA